MKTIKIWNDNPSEKQLDEIVKSLQDGEIIILPTDTLYGIVCDALNPKGIERVCRLKGINPDKTNLSIICHDIGQAADYAKFDNNIFRLLKTNTPGAFTFLCKSSSTLPKVFKGRKIVGIRIPNNRTARMVAERLGHPLLTTSVDYETEDYAINPSLIAESHDGKVDIMVEGDEGSIIPSTIVDCTQKEIEIIREGAGDLE